MEAAEAREIRIELGGTSDPRSDLDALETWLGREEWYRRLREDGRLRAERRAHDGRPEDEHRDPAMGIGLQDIVLVLLGSASQQILDLAARSTMEWLRNRRRLGTSGENPRATLVAPDGDRRELRGADTAAGGDGDEYGD